MTGCVLYVVHQNTDFNHECAVDRTKAPHTVTSYYRSIHVCISEIPRPASPLYLFVYSAHQQIHDQKCNSIVKKICFFHDKIFERGQTGLGRQSDTDHSALSSLIRTFTVCNSICIFRTHYCIAKPDCSN